ncbi:hypothetical protein AURDEDRAFT_110706 [Auricularia subglabra TFB-10046 SS5]|nr:hypothetical protein AURDEDRAFT_110706 [Auricularia subglabra TFB-10046 SS5]
MLSLARRAAFLRSTRVRTHATRPVTRLVETDELGLPKQPTWSVQELLSSYPTAPPTTEKLKHLHKLAALVPPEEGSEEWKRLSEDMSELIRLVEAVKLIDTTGVEPENLLEPITLSAVFGTDPNADAALYADEPNGTELLKHAEHQGDGFYVVDTPSSRRR